VRILNEVLGDFALVAALGLGQEVDGISLTIGTNEKPAGRMALPADCGIALRQQYANKRSPTKIIHVIVPPEIGPIRALSEPHPDKPEAQEEQNPVQWCRIVLGGKDFPDSAWRILIGCRDQHVFG